MYLCRNGKTATFVPDPEDYVKNDEDLTVEENFVVKVKDADGNYIASETYYKYPDKQQIKWCLLKHKGTTAHVVKEFGLTV